MKMQEATDIISGVNERQGYAVCFEWIERGILRTDYFPELRSEDAIETEEEAWALAQQFADKMRGRVCNLYVVNGRWHPVGGYAKRKIENR